MGSQTGTVTSGDTSQTSTVTGTATNDPTMDDTAGADDSMDDGASDDPSLGAGGNTSGMGGSGGDEPATGMGGSGGVGGGPGAGGSGGAGGEPGVDVEPVERELLSQTGLYSDVASETLAEGVMPYAPQFELYSDGADKRRWVYIPPGTQIETDEIDEWQFPIGTKLWKEFSRDGKRIETRLIEKLPPERADEGFEGWLVMAYVWNDELTDAVATPDGLLDAKDTDHDVPSQEACGRCHDMRVEKPLGFSAVQLSHEGEGVTMSTLLDQGLITLGPDAPLTVPGDDEQRQLIGYLHANCGHCHRARSPVNNRVSSLRMWLESDALASFEETNAYQSLVGQYSESGQGSILTYRVYGGDPDQSEMFRRITLRADSAELQDAGAVEGLDVPMPPLGTEQVDEELVELVRNWILALPPPQ